MNFRICWQRSLLLFAFALFLPSCQATSEDVVLREQPSLSKDPICLQVLALSSFTGSLESVEVRKGEGESLLIESFGGAEWLSAAWKKALDREDCLSIGVAAGDSFGRSQPLSAFFEERPTIEVFNVMGVDVDGLSNHNFDRGIAHLREMVLRSDYHWVTANLTNVSSNLQRLSPYAIFHPEVLPVAVMGLIDKGTAGKVFPGSFGTMSITEPFGAVLDNWPRAQEDGAKFLILLAPLDTENKEDGSLSSIEEFIAELSASLQDPNSFISGQVIVIGSGVRGEATCEERGPILLLHPRIGGEGFSQLLLNITPDSGVVESFSCVDVFQEIRVRPGKDGLIADVEMITALAEEREELDEILSIKIAEVDDLFAYEVDQFRTEQTPLGFLLAGALLEESGADVALFNAGNFKSSLPSQYQPRDGSLRRPSGGFSPPYDLLLGDLPSAMPFNNDAVIKDLDAVGLRESILHSLSALPEADGQYGIFAGIEVRAVFPLFGEAPSIVEVCQIKVESEDGILECLDFNRRYQLITSSFLAQGGDQYTAFGEARGVTLGLVRDLFQRYLESEEEIISPDKYLPKTLLRVSTCDDIPVEDRCP